MRLSSPVPSVARPGESYSDVILQLAKVAGLKAALLG